MRQVEPVNKAYRFQTKCKDCVYIGDPEDIESRPKLEYWGQNFILGSEYHAL